MNFNEFQQLFMETLERAVNNAENTLERTISKKLQIKMYGGGYSGNIITVEEAAKALFIEEEKFYRIIDIAVQEVSSTFSRVFVRVSGHQPVGWDQTWNTPTGSGPFKQILAQIIELTD